MFHLPLFRMLSKSEGGYYKENLAWANDFYAVVFEIRSV